MSDSLERDQLNLWQKLNRLYGEDEAPEDDPGDDSRQEESLESPEEKIAPEPEAMPEVEPGGQEPDGFENPGVLGSAVLEEVDMVESPDGEVAGEQTAINEVCADCRYDCRQSQGQFVISRCRLAAQSKPLHEDQTPNQMAASQGSMGIEKINETCRRCSRSCKQRTTKLNRMLCLGFLPLDK